MRTLFLCFIPLAILTSLHASDLTRSVSELGDRLDGRDLRGSLDGLAENFSAYKGWEEMENLLSLIEDSPSKAAELVISNTMKPEDAILIVYAASALPPSGFIEFWQEFSRHETLDQTQKRFVEHGLVLRDGRNVYTLTFNHADSSISDMLFRLRDLVAGNERASKIVASIQNGKLKGGQIEQFQNYGPRNWESLIPDLADESNPRIDKRDSPGDLKEPANVEEIEIPVGEESPPRSPNWPYILVAVALVGIVVVLVRSRKNQTGR